MYARFFRGFARLYVVQKARGGRESGASSRTVLLRLSTGAGDSQICQLELSSQGSYWCCRREIHTQRPSETSNKANRTMTTMRSHAFLVSMVGMLRMDVGRLVDSAHAMKLYGYYSLPQEDNCPENGLPWGKIIPGSVERDSYYDPP